MNSNECSATDQPIQTVAAVIADAYGRVLLVRKRDTRFFIQPGGKREAHESPLATLARELREELGVELVESTAVALGEFEAAAVNESGRRVRAIAYAVTIAGEPQPHAEIAELAWVDPHAPTVPVAPLSRDHILPAWAAVTRE
ncbi:NUDIX domain-containing protein [uncultured Aquimonas sp.]|uniref:NUDIX hydrolase n=1 Tax=uncultured Aquimonas sp. TaxID=385483 RepID=UPI00086AC5C5|nr:NUDIX domain-containing protein [uncultured Aquimonas sp.]ODU48011.1 MAG: NUDIX hydrolase [Xanthomonadaceae bacterium SCN 69-123]